MVHCRGTHKRKMKATVTLSLALAAGMSGAALYGAQPPMSPTAETAQHPARAWQEYPRWSRLTPQQLEADLRSAMAHARNIMDAICSVKPEDASFENVFRAYESIGLTLRTPEQMMLNLGATMDSPALRALQEKMTPELAAFRASITADDRLWAVVKHAAAQPWVAGLSPAKQRYVQQVCDEFRESGADLPAEKKARKAQVEARIGKLVMQYNGLLMDAKEAWSYVFTDKAELTGMPEDWLEHSAALAREKGFGTEEQPQWLVTLGGACSAAEVQARCTVPATRKLMWEGRQTVGCGRFDTAPVIAEIMLLRQELAELSGFANYADMVTAHRMVKNGQTALDFVDDLIARLKPEFEREARQLMDFAAQREGHPMQQLEPWDESYYERLLKLKEYQFDSESLRPYFEVSATIRGLFRVAATMFNLEFREQPNAEVWHPDVRLFEVYDTRTGHHLGSFYMDLYARTGKRSGAWQDTLTCGEPAAGGQPHRPHLATICTNFKPAAPGKPALLSHTEVLMLFHEFGHLMHALLSDTEMQSHNGCNVAWDFVELPSKLNEYWVWSPAVLILIAKHHETGKPIPDALLSQLIAAKRFMRATDKIYQLGSARLDLLMHMQYGSMFQDKDLDEVSRGVVAETRYPYEGPCPRSPMRTLNHCFLGGYAAGFYSYKWAEMLAADAFSRYADEGLLNPAAGDAYRETILSQGDSRPADELFRAFTGHAPSPKALLRELQEE